VTCADKPLEVFLLTYLLITTGAFNTIILREIFLSQQFNFNATRNRRDNWRFCTYDQKVDDLTPNRAARSIMWA